MVYDNARVMVARFVGHSEKEPTEALLKLTLYYSFRFRFTNTYQAHAPVSMRPEPISKRN